MSFPEAESTAHAEAAAASSKPEPESLMQLGRVLLSVLRDLPRLVSDRMDLLALDFQRAGRALGQLIGLALVLVVLGGTAWLLLWAGLLVGLMMAGLPDWGALLVAIGINALCMLWVIASIKARIPKLLLPAFRRHLSLTPLPEPDLPPESPPGPPPPAAMPPQPPVAPPSAEANIHDRSHASGSPVAT